MINQPHSPTESPTKVVSPPLITYCRRTQS